MFKSVLHGIASVLLVCLLAGPSVLADESAPRAPDMLVSSWIELATAQKPPLMQRTERSWRSEAITALAMFEAANAIDGAFPSYLGFEPREPGLTQHVAVSHAAATALSLLYPERTDVFRSALTETTPGGEPMSSNVAQAVELGEAAGRAAFERGMERLPNEPSPFRTSAPAGVYVQGQPPSLIKDFDLVLRPWVLDRANEMRAPPPADLTGATYAKDLQEVRDYGGKTGHKRTAEQTETARFWLLLDMNPVLRQIASRPGRTLTENARLYTMFYMTTDDAWVASTDAKVHYQFWRPITAIRQADRDGNADTDRDAYWSPFLPTPPHPEYPCAHCMVAAAQSIILEDAVGDTAATFTVRSSTTPDADAQTVTATEFARQTSLSRIYAGAHYRFSNTAGEDAGRKVAAKVLSRWKRVGE